MISRSTTTTALAVLGLLGWGCGSDDGGADPSSGTTGGSSTGEVTPGSTSSGSTGDAADDTSTGGSSSGGEPEPQGFDPKGDAPDLLSEYGLLDWDGTEFTYRENVYPYDMNTSLFSDFALKDRAIFIPPGETATYPEMSYPDNQVIDFPVGTVIVKSFSFPADFSQPDQNIDLIETRLLLRYPDEWVALPYVWDHELGDAVLTVQGDTRQVTFIDAEGTEQTANYLVPQKNQCAECHELKEEKGDDTFITPIGPNPRNLNRLGANGDNQLEHMAAAGVLEGLPPLAEVPQTWDDRALEDTPVEELDPETLVRAARDYLDVNCAHCHNPRGVSGISSQLFLNFDNEDEFNLGVCKAPGSAGNSGNLDYDIVPGNADESILIFRTESENVGNMMPLLGRSLVHRDGIALLRAWIDAMPPNDCMSE